MAPVLIIPGLGGSGERHWQTHLEQSLPRARRVLQTDWNHPDRAAWLERLVIAVEAAPGAILVAHSLGCAVVAHLAVHRPDLSIGAALLVAPADVDSARHTPEHIRGFAPMPRQRFAFRSIVVASTNDPFMAFGRARELASSWGADLVDAGASGHLNVDAGFGPWPAAERLVHELSGRARSAESQWMSTASGAEPSMAQGVIKYGT